MWYGDSEKSLFKTKANKKRNNKILISLVSEYLNTSGQREKLLNLTKMTRLLLMRNPNPIWISESITYSIIIHCS